MTDASTISYEDVDAASVKVPPHIAIIMDGNGRWAAERGMPRIEGHRMGVEAVRRCTRLAAEYGVEFLTLYSFSSENWNRPPAEISELFGLLRMFVRKHLAELHENNIRVRIIGEQERVPADILRLLEEATTLTQANTGLTLVIAFNYGSRGEIVEAVRKIARQLEEGSLSGDDIDVDLITSKLHTSAIPDPDLIIRTSGEKRLSNFLLWQAAYSELIFTDCYWPDFGEAEFLAALDEFSHRERRFGALSAKSV